MEYCIDSMQRLNTYTYASSIIIYFLNDLQHQKMSTFQNKAAWIASPKARPLQVGSGPTPSPSENEVVIKVAYAAVNPADWKVRKGS